MNIKEMAKEYAKHNPSIIDGGDGRFEYDYESPRLDYIAGANAVLNIIQEFIEHESQVLCSHGARTTLFKLDRLIDELKGE